MYIIPEMQLVVMESKYHIRPFSKTDSNMVLSIFNYYVREGFSAFPETPVSPEFVDIVTRDACGVFVAEGSGGV